MSASLDEEAAQKAKARESLIESKGMEELLKMVQTADSEVKRERLASQKRVTASAPGRWSRCDVTSAVSLREMKEEVSKVSQLWAIA